MLVFSFLALEGSFGVDLASRASRELTNANDWWAKFNYDSLGPPWGPICAGSQPACNQWGKNQQLMARWISMLCPEWDFLRGGKYDRTPLPFDNFIFHFLCEFSICWLVLLFIVISSEQIFGYVLRGEDCFLIESFKLKHSQRYRSCRTWKTASFSNVTTSGSMLSINYGHKEEMFLVNWEEILAWTRKIVCLFSKIQQYTLQSTACTAGDHFEVTGTHSLSACDFQTPTLKSRCNRVPHDNSTDKRLLYTEGLQNVSDFCTTICMLSSLPKSEPHRW